jgi:hypothetical protein
VSRRRLGRRSGLAALAATLLAGIAAPSVLPQANAEITQYGVTSDNVKHVKFIPFEVGTATGARVIGDYLFVTSWKNISIYSIKDRLNPQLISTTPIGFMFENEDVATDGKILLFSESLPGDALHVWDLQSYEQPREVGTLQGSGDHTTSCLLSCKFSYGSSGSITDLRRIDQPKAVGNWIDLVKKRDKNKYVASPHDLTEVAPGMMLTSSQPISFIDARNPLKPKILAEGKNADGRFIHSILWPRKGKDRFILAGGETNAETRCSEQSARFTVWDTKNWQRTHKFTMVDEYKYQNGVIVDGNPVVNGLGCSSHWFNEHPTWKDGGLVAVASYEHGTKFLTVNSKGKMKEVGFYEPIAGSQSAVYWVTPKLAYTVDYGRGIDILEYNGPLKAK